MRETPRWSFSAVNVMFARRHELLRDLAGRHAMLRRQLRQPNAAFALVKELRLRLEGHTHQRKNIPLLALTATNRRLLVRTETQTSTNVARMFDGTASRSKAFGSSINVLRVAAICNKGSAAPFPQRTTLRQCLCADPAMYRGRSSKAGFVSNTPRLLERGRRTSGAVD